MFTFFKNLSRFKKALKKEKNSVNDDKKLSSIYQINAVARSGEREVVMMINRSFLKTLDSESRKKFINFFLNWLIEEKILLKK